MTAFSAASLPDRARSGRRTRPVVATALVAIIALVASSCSSGQAWIARVDKTPIDSPNFWAGVPLYANLANGGTTPIGGDERGVSEMNDAATYAMFLIQSHALGVINEERGVEVNEAAINSTRQTLLSSQQAAMFKDLPSWFLDQIVVAQANYEALGASFQKSADLDAQVAAYYKQNQAQFRQVCMDVISGEEAELAAARKRLEEGTDFPTVAKAVAAAQPPQNGQPAVAIGEKADGDAGCVPTTQLTSLFADPSGVTTLTDAEPNELVGPVPVAGGLFMLFRVRSTEVEPLATARATIEQALAQQSQQKAQDALNKFLIEADIDLNPRIGSWSRGVGYQPPAGAELPAGQTTIPAQLSGAAG